MITANRSAELDLVLIRFEEQYEAHTERLGRLLARRADRRAAVHNLAEIASCRRALAETARVLQRMAEHDFGSCTACAGDIPLDLLLAEPQRRACPDCVGVVRAVPA